MRSAARYRKATFEFFLLVLFIEPWLLANGTIAHRNSRELWHVGTGAENQEALETAYLFGGQQVFFQRAVGVERAHVQKQGAGLCLAQHAAACTRRRA